MTRQEYIDAVKVKIEEISPFDEPDAFIANDPTSPVKPIISYIKESLDEATRNCLRALPLSLLHADIQSLNTTLSIDSDGVGRVVVPNGSSSAPVAYRFVRFHHEDLERDITAFVTSEDPIYLLQQNKYTRGKLCKPVAVLSSGVLNGFGQLEIYTLTPDSSTTHESLVIDINKKVGESSDFPNNSSVLVLSPISEFVVLECARIVLNILEKYDAAKVCENEMEAKIQAILK